jgi:hypothetical protein
VNEWTVAGRIGNETIAAIPDGDGGNREPELEPAPDCMMIA